MTFSYNSGAFRNVEIHEDYVIKTLESYLEDEEAEEGNPYNWNEIEIYKDFGKDYHVFYPVNIDKGRYDRLIMRRAQEWDGKTEFSNDYVEALLKAFLKSKSPARVILSSIEVTAAVVDFREQMNKMNLKDPSLYDFVLDDLCPRISGLLNKKLVIFDYGGCYRYQD